MTRVSIDDDVILCVAFSEHPLVVGEDDDRTDEELTEAVTARTSVDAPLSFPGWQVFESGPPDAETFRYVNTKARINVKLPYDGEVKQGHKTERDVFDVIASHLHVDGWSVIDAAMSHYGAVHPDDHDGDVHLDLTDSE
jgi:hypothetical protein